jgi:putative AlgH/UPF0301 family transcriptional regulator
VPIGLEAAQIMVEEQDEGSFDHGVRREHFKFFFNYGSWQPGNLENEVRPIARNV